MHIYWIVFDTDDLFPRVIARPCAVRMDAVNSNSLSSRLTEAFTGCLNVVAAETVMHRYNIERPTTVLLGDAGEIDELSPSVLFLRQHFCRLHNVTNLVSSLFLSNLHMCVCQPANHKKRISQRRVI